MRPQALWVRVVVVVVVVAFAVAAAAAIFTSIGSGSAAPGPGDAPSTSPSAAPTSADGIPTLPKLGTTAYVTPFKDVGPASAVAAIKKLVPTLLTEEVSVQRLPANLQQRKVIIEDPRAIAARKAAVARVWVPDQRAGIFGELEEALKEVGADKSYHPFDDNRFVLSKWQGVGIAGSTVTVLLTGHEEYRLGDEGWQADPDAQYQLTLGRQDKASPHAWGLVGEGRSPLPAAKSPK